MRTIWLMLGHGDVIKWKHFSRYWPFVRGIHLSPVNSPHKGRWRGTLKFSLICTWINGWVNNGEIVDLRRHLAHFDITVIFTNSRAAISFTHWIWVGWTRRVPRVCMRMLTDTRGACIRGTLGHSNRVHPVSIDIRVTLKFRILALLSCV